MRKLILLLVAFSLIISCEKDKQKDPLPTTEGDVYYISNEGAFGFGNSSVSMYLPDEDILVNDVFKNTNDRRPGDVLQSIYKYESKLYLMVNASNKIEIAAGETLGEMKVLHDLPLVRYMEQVGGDNAFVSIWGKGGKVVKIDLKSDVVLDSISVGNGPERMLYSQGKLFVVNSGGFSSDSTVSIIDVENNKVEETLIVKDNPIDIVAVSPSEIWVLCKGSVQYDANWQVIGHSSSYIVKIDAVNNQIIKQVKLSESMHPTRLCVSPNKKFLYFGAGFGVSGIYRYDITNDFVELTALVSEEFYGFNIHPQNGDIYGFLSPSFTASGKMILYTSAGVKKMEKTLGVGPNGIIF